MKKLISTIGLDRAEWLGYRKRGLGGSDAGAVCGLNPYRTAMQVYQDKTTDHIEDIDNEAMRQRREFEDYVARRFTEATGKKVRKANFMYYDEEQHPFMLADAWYIAVLIYGREFKYYKIERDEEMLKDLIRIEEDFWEDHVLKGVLPEPGAFGAD